MLASLIIVQWLPTPAGTGRGYGKVAVTCRKYDPTTAIRHINVRSMDPRWEEQMSPADDKFSVNRKNTNTATSVHQECCAHKSTDMHSHSTC